MNKFSRFSWGVTAYTIIVILWGAFVRATGSGAGCGNHWPTCNGQLIPQPEEIATAIEFSHRLSSSLSGFLVLIMLIWAWRTFPKGSLPRKGAALSFFFILIEGAIGAMLVRLELVADNASQGRAFVVALHLANTLFLLAAMVATSYWGNGGQSRPWLNRTTPKKLLFVALLALIIVSTAGAVTALGDTLFPVESLQEGMLADLDPASHFLIRLRIWHPIFAILTSAYIYFITQSIKPKYPHLKQLIQFSWLILAIQLTAGTLNVVLLAPVWLQLIHLLLADILWITLLLILFKLE